MISLTMSSTCVSSPASGPSRCALSPWPVSDEFHLLGDYVRACRELVTPAQAGIPSVGVRRVPGLRREEVAMLAGISADYCLRLEQGRDRNPSAQVLESLARVLQLDDDAAAYLLRLGTGSPRRRRRRAPEGDRPSGRRQARRRASAPD
ncbi:helix-turn-helix domain-containing protein [Nonomuraea angiospora]